MTVRGDWPRSRSERATANNMRGRGTETCSVERAKVHVKALYFPSPVPCTPEIYHPFRTVAYHPTSINGIMTEGSANSSAPNKRCSQADGGCSLYIYLAVGQPPGDIAKYRSIPPHIATAQTRLAVPIKLCLVIQ